MHQAPSSHGPLPENPDTDSALPPGPDDNGPDRPNKSARGRRALPIAVAAVLAAGAGAAAVAALDDNGTPPANVKTVQAAAVEPVAAAGRTSDPQPVVQATTPVAGEKSINEIYREAGPGVVRVEQQAGQGSGFVVDDEGYIATNAHVVEGVNTVYVSFSNNDRVEARVVGSDPATDVALLQADVPASALTPIPLGTSADVQVGDGVVAIGNPFGLDRTVTSGIVSAISREIPAPNGITAIRDAIQTDAAINHGNSGGPLLNMRGEVIGINSQIETGGTGNGNVGVGFAVPVDMVKDVLADLRAHGVVKHAWLGVSLSAVDAALAKRVDVGSKDGAMVASLVPSGPAAAAGLHASTDRVVIDGQSYAIGGDVIVSVDGAPVHTVREVQDAVVKHKPGDTVTLGVVRTDGSKAEVKVTLGDLPTGQGQAQQQP